MLPGAIGSYKAANNLTQSSPKISGCEEDSDEQSESGGDEGSNKQPGNGAGND